MSEDDAIALVFSLGSLVVLLGMPAIILAVAAFSATRTDPGAPKPTGIRGLGIALVGHLMGVITMGLALFGVLGCFVFFEGDPRGPELVGAYSMVPLTVGGFLLAPTLFGVGLAIARGGGQKTRIGVLAVAAWVAMHHLFATATLLCLFAHELDPTNVAWSLVPAVAGVVHAAAMAWVGIAKIGAAPI